MFMTVKKIRKELKNYGFEDHKEIRIICPDGSELVIEDINKDENGNPVLFTTGV